MIMLLINKLTSTSRSSDFVMITFTDRVRLKSVLLPLKVHLTVDHIKKTMKAIYTLSIGFQYFLFCLCWWERRLTEFDRTVSDKITGLTDWHLGTLKFFVRALNILNKSDKHFLPFHDLFNGLEAHIHFGFHLEKYIFIITFTSVKIKEFYEEQLKKESEMKQFFFLTYLKLAFI